MRSLSTRVTTVGCCLLQYKVVEYLLMITLKYHTMKEHCS